ncbi:ATP-binding protein [Phenylobacterium sp. LjRoot225]|uniref:hybrid sensor histidine kinase/response regulator n=1 Tax=Phenylobacterium sp. LjRoot225 TaxID=3342285 RepID=UPI003ECDBF0D
MGLQRETSEYRSVAALFCIAILLIVVSGAALIGFSWRALDQQEASRETLVAHRYVQRTLRRIGAEVLSGTQWDEAWLHTRNGLEPKWIDDHLVAAYYQGSFGHNLGLMWDSHGSLAYAARERRRAPVASVAACASALRPMVLQLQRQELARRRGLDASASPAPAVGYTSWRTTALSCGDEVYLLALSTLGPSDGRTSGAQPASVVASGLRIDRELLRQFDDDLGVSGARLLHGGEPGMGRVVLVDAAPGPSPAIAWRVARPGPEALWRARGYVLAALVLLTCTFDLLRRRIRRLLRASEAYDRARRVALAEAQAASKMKSEFIANVSHEIRTPLNGVLGMAQALEREPLTPRQLARVQTIRRSGEVLLDLLNDVLDLSKIEAGRLEIETAAFDVESMVADLITLHQEVARTKGVRLSAKVGEAAVGQWRGDRARLRQILQNLLSNAVKFTAHGEVSVEVFKAPGGLGFAVVDQGIGIAPDQLDRLFQKFSQADGSITRRYGGTGLGLAISRELAQRMGGDIQVTSELGRGSRFEVVLPLAPASEPVPATEDEAPFELRPRDSAPVRVLAAEDNPVNQLVLKALLEPLEIELTMVADGLEAVEAARQAPFDLILMDMQMPVMDGLEATRQIRADEKGGGRRTPIIALTADAMAHQIEAATAAGVDGHVPKPIESQVLYAALDLALRLGSGSADAESTVRRA